VIVVGERRGRLDGIDANDRAAQPLLVRTHLRGQVRERRLASQLPAQRFTRRLELAALAPHTTRPGILAQRVDHRAADAPFGKRLELDAAAFIEAAGGIHEPNDPVLDEITDVNRVRHRGRNAAGELLDERNAGNDPRVFLGTVGAHWTYPPVAL